MIKWICKNIYKIYLRYPCDPKKCMVFVNCSSLCEPRVKYERKMYKLEERADKVAITIVAVVEWIAENFICGILSMIVMGIAVIITLAALITLLSAI